MGKPGGFFKRLKAKQARAASRRRRGTKGASKQERKAKQAEKAEYYAAKRTAEQLAAISSSSDDDDDYEAACDVSNSNRSSKLSHKKRHRRDVDSEEEVEQLAQRRLQRLRAVLGVKTKTTLEKRQERTSKRKKSVHDRDSVLDGSDGDEEDEDEDEVEAEEESKSESEVDKKFMKSAKHHDSNSSSDTEDGDYDDENDDDFLIEDEDMEDRDTEIDNEEEDDEDDEDDVNGVLNPLLALEEEEDDNNDNDVDNFVVNDEEEDEEEEEEEDEEEDDDNDDDKEEEDPYFSENDNENEIDETDECNVAETAESINGSKRIASSLSPTNGNNTHSTRQDEASLLLPHFELGTSSLEVIVQNTPIHRDDVWLQKYHLDVYDRPGKANNLNREENTDTSAPEHMSNVTIPTSVINKLKHSNDELLAQMKKEDAFDENVASKHHNTISQHSAQTQLEEAEKKLFTVHNHADLLEWQPENISILATKTAQHHFKHPPFDVKDVITTKCNAKQKGDKNEKKNNKNNSLNATTANSVPTADNAATLASDDMPSYMHPTLWSKFVEYKLRASSMTREDVEPEMQESLHLNVAAKRKVDKVTNHHVPLLTYEERGLLDLLEVYCDVLDCTRIWQNSTMKREVYCLHLLNHWFKARSVVLAHDALLRVNKQKQCERVQLQLQEQQQESEEHKNEKLLTKKKKEKRKKINKINGDKTKLKEDRKVSIDDINAFDDFELRDRGFGKTRLCVMLPMRNIALRYVHTLMSILGVAPSQCTKYDLFRSDFSEIDEATDTSSFSRRALDYQRQFVGNVDDNFCVGVRLGTHALHLYAHPLNSDLLLCSPLGLRTRLEKNADLAVALSSIEVCVMDEAHVILQQNWEHAYVALQLLNRKPTDTTFGLNDLRRVYSWALRGESAFHMQTILCSNWTHALLTSTFRDGACCVNQSGKVMVQRATETGVLPRVLLSIRQYFIRFHPASLDTVDEDRFRYFTEHLYVTKLQPLVERNVRVIIFAPSYFDFVRLRQYMYREHRESYSAISEYTSLKQQRQALGRFSDLETPVLLLTERFYFFKRYFVKLGEVLVNYSPPLNSSFYAELVNKLTATSPNALVLTLYCRYDSHEMNRIVGTSKLRQMMTRDSDIVSFVTN